MPLTPGTKQRLLTRMRNQLTRSEDLFSKLVTHGLTRDAEGNAVPLRQPDRRDIAQFLFFESAAQFEGFMQEAFVIEARKHFDVMPSKAAYLVGTVDNGLRNVMGWGSPQRLAARGTNLFGANGYFGRLHAVLGNQVYQRLVWAHALRNRIAHSAGDAGDTFTRALQGMQIPARARRGISVGRVLLDYPGGAPATDKWFHRLLQAYEEAVDHFDATVSVP